MGLHAFIGRHLFKIRQYLRAFIYQQAYILHLVKDLQYNIYRQAAYVIHQPTSCPAHAFLNIFKASICYGYIHTKEFCTTIKDYSTFRLENAAKNDNKM